MSEDIILSPLSGKKINILYRISTLFLCKKYEKIFKLDVKKYFKDMDYILICSCKETGYKFFYPYSVEGQADLYEKLQENDWYYMPWKWEHRQALEYIKPGFRVLEVGSGPGGFLEGVWQERGVKGTGLELNTSAAKAGREKKLDIREESLEAFSAYHEEQFDLACSFQVLEHISSVRNFFLDQIKCLKPGGLLIVAVPNNAGFIKDDFNLLNVPPHHMGLWEEKSLINAGKLFGLKHVATHFEPLQHHHRNYFFGVLHKRLPKIVVAIIYRLKLENLLFPKQYRAFTILMVWQKL